jgi:HK97 gp10 family phage protein
LASRWEVEGADRLYLNLEALHQYVSSDAEQVTRTELAEVGQDIVDYAVELAPRDTGRLKAEIGMTVGDDGVTIHSGAPYSIFVEFGTIKMEERPFLRPAYHRYGIMTRLQQRHQVNIERLFR